MHSVMMAGAVNTSESGNLELQETFIQGPQNCGATSATVEEEDLELEATEQKGIGVDPQNDPSSTDPGKLSISGMEAVYSEDSGGQGKSGILQDSRIALLEADKELIYSSFSVLHSECQVEESGSSFVVMDGKCRSEDDDGYCSRSSLDSPVQAVQSDSEVYDSEVFTIKECCTTSSGPPGQNLPTDDQRCENTGDLLADCTDGVTSTSSVNSSSALFISPTSMVQSAGQQKIMIVNKTSNIKYLISRGVAFPRSADSTVRKSSLRSVQEPVSNLVNVKFLKMGPKKFQPGKITLLRVPDKTSPMTLTLSGMDMLVKTNSSPSEEQEEGTYQKMDESGQTQEIGTCVLEPTANGADIGSQISRNVLRSAFDCSYLKGNETAVCPAVLAENSVTSDASLYQGDWETYTEATSVALLDSSQPTYEMPLSASASSVVGSTYEVEETNASSVVSAAGDNAKVTSVIQLLPECPEIQVCDTLRSEYPLMKDAPVSAVANDKNKGLPDAATDDSLMNGNVCRLAEPSSSQGESFRMGSAKMDSFKKPLPITDFCLLKADPQRSRELASAQRASSVSQGRPVIGVRSVSNTNSQKILKACLSSIPVEQNGQTNTLVKVAVNGQVNLTTKSNTYHLANRNSQDVTVILLPQASLQTVPANETSSKQVVLQIGPSQVLRTKPVGTDCLKSVSSLRTSKNLLQTSSAEGKQIASACDNLWNDVTLGEARSANRFEFGSKVAVKTSVISDNLVTSKLGRKGTGGISGLNVEDSQVSQKLTPDKAAVAMPKSSASIGRFASLSLQSLTSNIKVTSQNNANSISKRSASSAVSLSNLMPVATVQYRSQKPLTQGTSGNSSAGRNRVLCQGLQTVRKPNQSSGHLHPLIDHDYCEFATFCADIQSSIISLTDSSVRPERRYIKKTRAARTKALRVSQYISENCSTDSRPKRKYCKRKQTTNTEVGRKCSSIGGKLKGSGKVVVSAGRVATATKDGASSASTEDKNYVKIPGCYQDDFVYFATKRLPGRPRNRDDAVSKTNEAMMAKPPVSTAAGISMFDWYKEMAQTDKTSRFGASEIPGCSLRSDSGMGLNRSGNDCTPVDESDVADLVMDMLPSGDLVRPIADDMKFMTSSSIVDSLLSGMLDMSNITTPGSELSNSVDVGNTDLNFMAEEVRQMLSSMGEAELKLLESHLENDKSADDIHEGLDINCYLADYTGHENNASLSQSSVSNLLDVDDISDGDLLSADIANMNIILNDLNSAGQTTTCHEDAAVTMVTGEIGSIFDKNISGCRDFMGDINDLGTAFSGEGMRAESEDIERLKKENDAIAVIVSASQSSGSDTVTVPILSDTSPPELTTINMFWNDLPGLLMNGREFVRLVDIHKQIMPAKDTGILKKRCHMMGLHITNCTELQRDFLIRYMNAAKSKSTVIIAKDAAILLIGFYVNPKSRSRGVEDFELDMLPPSPPVKPSKISSQQGRRSVPNKLKQVNLQNGNQAGSIVNKSNCPGKLPHPVNEVPSVTIGSDLVPEAGFNIKRSERLRHKLVSYSGLIHGSSEDTERSSRSDASYSRSTPDCITDDNQTDPQMWKKTHAISENEEVELENLIREQKRRRLSLEEKLRLKLLRNSRKGNAAAMKQQVGLALKGGTQRRLLKHVKRTRHLLAWRRNRKKSERNRKGPACTRSLHTLEHCYAASPTRLTSSPKKQDISGKQKLQISDHQVARNNSMGASGSITSQPPTLTEKTSASSDAALRNSLGVIHRDVTCRVNRRRRSQIGELIAQLYTSNDALCIRCSSCGEMLSVQQFLKHMHWRRGSNKLVRVTVSQKLQLQSSSRTPSNMTIWEEFTRKRTRFEAASETIHITPVQQVAAEKRVSLAKEQNETEMYDSVGTATVQPSTRHSIRVCKRKQLHPVERYVFVNGQPPYAEVKPSAAEEKRRRKINETENCLSTVAVQCCSVSCPSPTPTPSSVNGLNLSSQQKPNLLPNTCRNGRTKRLMLTTSDRSLRATTRRSQEARMAALIAQDKTKLMQT